MKSSQAGLLALGLVGAGFCVGYGFGAGRRHTDEAATPPARPLAPPLLKGMRASPDGRLLALTSVSDGARHASRFVIDLQTLRFNARQAPSGWQDYVTGWTPDSRVVFEREKIPRPTEDAKPGIYAERVSPPDLALSASSGSQKSPLPAPSPQTPELLSGQALPSGEKVTGGFLDPNGQLVVRSRREPKSVYALSPNGARLLAAGQTQLYQTRAVRDGAQTVYFIASDVPGKRGQAALYRVDAKGKRQIGRSFDAPAWMYLREDAHQLIVCEGGDTGQNWTLCDVSARGLIERKRATLPQDVIAVYWSPDGKTVLGTGGDDVWAISASTLQARRLPKRGESSKTPRDWDADDATWLPGSQDALVAADGAIYRVPTNGQPPRELWRVPQRFWK